MNNNTAEDYGLQDESPSPADNGNGKGKKFNIVKATDPSTQAILSSREDALIDPRLKGKHSAFIVLSIDRCTQFRYWQHYERGVCSMADSVVARILCVSERWVFHWRHHPATRDYLWFRKERRPDKWAQMVYHLVALHPEPKQRTEWKDVSGGAYAAGAKARPGEPAPDAAARGREKIYAALAAKRAQKNLPLTGGVAVLPKGVTGSGNGPKWPKASVFRRNSADARRLVLLTAEVHFCRQQKPTSADSRSAVLPTAEAHFGCEQKSSSAVSSSEPLPPAEQHRRVIETKEVVVVKVSPLGKEGEGTAPPKDDWETEFRKWQAGLAKKFDRELRATLDDLKGERQSLKEFGAGKPGTETAIARLKLKIEAVKAALTGPR